MNWDMHYAGEVFQVSDETAKTINDFLRSGGSTPMATVKDLRGREIMLLLSPGIPLLFVESGKSAYEVF